MAGAEAGDAAPCSPLDPASEGLGGAELPAGIRANGGVDGVGRRLGEVGGVGGGVSDGGVLFPGAGAVDPAAQFLHRRSSGGGRLGG